jgi:mono/diheme cytochrome c family protein
MSRLSISICCTIALISGGLVAASYAADNMAPAQSAASAASETAQLAPVPSLGGVTYTQPATLPADPVQKALVQRGEYLTIAGDCSSCHSVSGEPMFSGGYAVDTPVGTIYSPNITSSKQYGIGNWTDADFYNVMHNGIRPGRSLLVFPAYIFPVMPYSSYSKLSYQDVMAIKAYLESIPPVEKPNRPMTIPFPLNIRAGQLALRILTFHPKPIQYDPSWNASQRNGAYLAQALGHCSECHTPRNILLASDMSRYYAGGQIISQSWYAPNISSSKQHGIGAWDDASLVAYLHDGGDMVHGAPFGPMQEVVDESLSRLPVSDVQDLVAYLRTVGPQDPATVTVNDPASPAEGSVGYAQNCARCHGAGGAGVNNNFPNLAHNDAISDGKPNDVISMLLGGFQPWHPNQSAMPAFGNTLSDQQIAAVTNYIRTSWGNQGAANAGAHLVARLRGVTVQEVALDDGTMQAVLNDGTSARRLQNISGTFELEGNRTNCQISADLGAPGAGGAAPIHLGGACTNQGYTLQGDMTSAGKTSPVTLALNDMTANGKVTGVTLDGPLADGSHLSARINFITPNE